MKRSLMPAAALPTMKKIAFALLCCSLLMLVAAPAWGDECSECGNSESVTRTFSPGNNTQTFAYGTGSSAHSFTLTLNSVLTTFDVTLTANYVDSQVVGSTTGICPSNVTAPADDDIDCRLAFGGFVYATLGNGDRVVPQCVAYHLVGNNAQCAWYHAETTAQLNVDYTGPVYDFIGWNTNTPPAANGEYAPGWNVNNARLYDHPGTDTSDNFFVSDITDWYNPNCTASTCGPGGDGGGGGHQPALNDWVWAYVPNPQGTADNVELLVPVPGISPFKYIAKLPMLVTFELENGETSDPNALTKPHAVGFATLDPGGNSIPVQFPKGFPTTFTYNKFLRVYWIFLSPTPYMTDGTVYTLQLNSDLFPQPVNATFKVVKPK